jgi:hypothetical protein
MDVSEDSFLQNSVGWQHKLDDNDVKNTGFIKVQNVKYI